MNSNKKETELSLPDFKLEAREEFQNLMQQRVQEILLVSSQYDSFILARDGQLSELLLSEYVGLNLYHSPSITHVNSGKEAIAALKGNHRFDLIITTMRIGDMPVLRFAKNLRKMKIKMPLVLLTYETRELYEMQESEEAKIFDKIFLWQGDFRIVLGIVKYIEDRMNVDHDAREFGVQVIIIVEDNVRFYSAYIPIVYAEIMRHSQNLISEGINLAHKILRMRARPKIILCENFEEAWEYYEHYKRFVLGVITDIEFPMKGRKNPEAGKILSKKIRESNPDIPIVLQSFQPEIADIAEELSVGFARKDSPTLLNDLRHFMIDHLGFGDFVFRMPDGKEVGRARNIKELEKLISKVPAESLIHHGERNHFSAWLKARTEFTLAARLRPRKVSEWTNVDDMRDYIIKRIRETRRERNRKTIAEFSKETFDSLTSFANIGNGSLGGKARGLAFISHVINYYRASDRFDGITISIPPTVVLCTDVFDRFMEINNLLDFAMQEDDDNKILHEFLRAEFPMEYIPYLRNLIELMTYPLAIRSSSLLEDSQYQPFAGVYCTFMRPNNNPDPLIRLEELIISIKHIYASVYFTQAKHYMDATPYRLEEEKMAVIIQKLIGADHNGRFYPEISGVAKSHNFYPKPPMKADDGIVAAALGLGQYVVEGGETIRFCPKYPQHNQQFSNISDFRDHTQKEFYALDLKTADTGDPCSDVDLTKYPLAAAEEDKTLYHVGSIYSPENDAIYDGLSRDGIRLATFAPILKYNTFPLAEVINHVLELGKKGMGGSVEIEFAANLSVKRKEPKEFAILQMRPLVLSREMESLEIGSVKNEDIICYTEEVLGVGVIEDLKDIIVVDFEKFERSKSREAAKEIEMFNSLLQYEERSYILIGVGRWGSADPWLGIPVSWEQISDAKVIVETSFQDIKVTPSQGAHFFHNLTSFQVGYFTVNIENGPAMIDWLWLASQKEFKRGTYVRHLRFKRACKVKMNGYKNKGVIYKPGKK